MRVMMRMGATEIVERRVMGTAMMACPGRRLCKGCSKVGMETMVVRGQLHVVRGLALLCRRR